jgi:hypothetical protein
MPHSVRRAMFAVEPRFNFEGSGLQILSLDVVPEHRTPGEWARGRGETRGRGDTETWSEN